MQLWSSDLWNCAAWLGAAVLCATILVAPTLTVAQSPKRLPTGTLECSDQATWNDIVNSAKDFSCTFTTSAGETLGSYKAVVPKFDPAYVATGKKNLQWVVFGPDHRIGDEYLIGSLAGTFAVVDTGTSISAGLGANVLLGSGVDAFALKPINARSETGYSVASGVEVMILKYVGPAA